MCGTFFKMRTNKNRGKAPKIENDFNKISLSSFENVACILSIVGVWTLGCVLQVPCLGQGSGQPSPASLRLWKDVSHKSHEVLASSCAV